ncbi:unnamed protein product [Rotaria socialis]|uniref:Uncharacterized protein n=1 Tax=Rotaria socialis TaxID=392032 RepID=A0A820EN10_9BILA|nr:unnamed protein product [Rotaria socialis]CAF4251399.1 unnamed protein product [Rotaria socialis]
MLFANQYTVFCTIATLIITITGQQICEDFSADAGSCTKFIRCFHNIRIRFTCPSGTAWEESLRTCLSTEYVERCQKINQKRIAVDATNDTDLFDADIDALLNITMAASIAEARALGPMIMPRQYRCSFCNTGACAVVANTIKCYCGNSQCQPATTTTVQPRNPCSFNPCVNGGQCVPIGQGFICNCPATFTGNRCEAPAPTPCQPNPCQNGGICTPQGSSFTCMCLTGFNGFCCENRITTTTPFNPCAQSPCQNGGTCIPQGSSFMCICPSTFTGFCCETCVTTTTPFNPCAQSVCQNGGQCIPTGNTFLCQCPNGFYGTRCESRNYCMPNPCANNGLCTQTTTGYICSCSFPYTGTNCQQIISTTTTTTVAPRAPCGTNCACVTAPCPVAVVTNPCAPNPCQNNGGCAVQNNNVAKCWCPDSFQGYYCQHRRSARSLISKTCNKDCLNGGQCYIDEKQAGQAFCSCSNDFYGSRCEFMNRPKSCSPKNPCMNNAKCITTSSGAQCMCERGTSGVLCERIERLFNEKHCPLNCQAGGTCVYVSATPTCRCPPGLNGPLCEIRSG